jgi:hypothetical protein
MNHVLSSSRACAFGAAVIVAFAVAIAAQTASETLATVNIPRSVMANGKPLAAGTYTLRLTGELAAPASGQTPEASPWVEFVQGDQVKGREVAIVVKEADAQSVLKGPGPRPGTARVDMLVGDEYLRIWVNHGGTNYLLHLPVK